MKNQKQLTPEENLSNAVSVMLDWKMKYGTEVALSSQMQAIAMQFDAKVKELQTQVDELNKKIDELTEAKPKPKKEK